MYHLISVDPPPPATGPSVGNPIRIDSPPPPTGQSSVIKSVGAAMEFPFEELLQATNNLSQDNLIGEGGYGKVYKGLLRYTEVAIKLLSEVRC